MLKVFQSGTDCAGNQPLNKGNMARRGSVKKGKNIHPFLLFKIPVSPFFEAVPYTTAYSGADYTGYQPLKEGNIRIRLHLMLKHLFVGLTSANVCHPSGADYTDYLPLKEGNIRIRLYLMLKRIFFGFHSANFCHPSGADYRGYQPLKNGNMCSCFFFC